MIPPNVRELEQPLRVLLRNFTYRPGWVFSVEDGYLKINARVIDAENQTETTPLNFEQQIPFNTALHQVQFDWTNWLFNIVLKIERHEAQEFFRINGQPVYEPHPEIEK